MVWVGREKVVVVVVIVLVLYKGFTAFQNSLHYHNSQNISVINNTKKNVIRFIRDVFKISEFHSVTIKVNYKQLYKFA